MIPVFAACSDSEPTSPEVPQTPAPQQNAVARAVLPASAAAISDQEIIEQTRVPAW